MSHTRFGIIPAAVFQLGLDPAEIAALAFLSTCVDASGWCAPGAEAVGSACQRSRAWAVAALASLQSKGVLVGERAGAANRFRIVYDAAPCQPADAATPVGQGAAHSRGVSRLTPDRQPADTATVRKPQKSAIDEIDDCQPADIQPSAPISTTSKNNTSGEKREARRRSQLSAGWQPDAALRAWAASQRPDLDIDNSIASFVDYWTGEGRPKADWSATFRNWIRREKPSNGKRPGGAGQGGAPLDPDTRLRRAAAGAVAARVGRGDGPVSCAPH